MSFGMVYDPVPFVNNFVADNFGHMILVSDDSSGVAYIGLDVEDFYRTPNVYGFQSHRLRSKEPKYPGYLDRIDALIEYGQFPIRTSGYVSGNLCTLGELIPLMKQRWLLSHLRTNSNPRVFERRGVREPKM